MQNYRVYAHSSIKLNAACIYIYPNENTADEEQSADSSNRVRVCVGSCAHEHALIVCTNCSLPTQSVAPLAHNRVRRAAGPSQWFHRSGSNVNYILLRFETARVLAAATRPTGRRSQTQRARYIAPIHRRSMGIRWCGLCSGNSQLPVS